MFDYYFYSRIFKLFFDILLLILIFQKYNPQLVYFFGSAYRGRLGPLSDIDLAVLWSEGTNVPMLRSLQLQAEILDFLKEDRFEVGCLNGQNLSFCYNVVKTGICIYGKEEDLDSR